MEEAADVNMVPSFTRAGNDSLCHPLDFPYLHVASVSDHPNVLTYQDPTGTEIEVCRQLVRFTHVLLEILTVKLIIAGKLASSQQPLADKPQDGITDFSNEEENEDMICVTIFTLILLPTIG
jgi:hypothetical protein